MWQKAVLMGHPLSLELTREGLQVSLANHYTIRGAHRHVIVVVIYLAFFA